MLERVTNILSSIRSAEIPHYSESYFFHALIFPQSLCDNDQNGYDPISSINNWREHLNKKAKTMRCPKCGYISFDNQETCRKCNKNIGDTVAEINGTVCDALPPSFLQLETKIRIQAQPSSPPIPDKNIVDADNEPIDAMIEEMDTDFVLDDQEVALADENEDLVMDLDGLKEESPREEYTLDLGEDRGGIETTLPPLDFGDLDISDLAPPDKEQVGSQVIEEELEPVAALSENLPPPQKAPAPKSTGLEDLQVNGLDLDAPAKFVTGSAAGKRYLPSVKTGTALDKFDVDLGELFEQNKK